MRSFCLLLIGIILSTSVFAQEKLQTVAEKSNYTATSSHSDVLKFIDGIRNSKYIKVEKIATTLEGREIPLLIVGNPLPKNPNDIGDRVVVYIQANIHSGEVEGKEASLMLVRDLISKKNNEIFKNVVLLVCPNLNADGNDRMSNKNRTNQNGPSEVGVRHNALMLDLNRDAMKLESTEMQGVIENVLNRWDPTVVMDCHTTNGSYHQEPVTFTWMMNPNGDRTLINFMRDKMMPEVSSTLRNKYSTLNCFYGEFIDQKDYEQGWISYASEPRYFSNYVGLRNRFSILNENYVYADYKSRVLGCYNLISSLVDYSAANKDKLKQLIAEADRKTLQIGISAVDSFSVKYTGVPTPEKVTILTYEAEAYTDEKGRERFRKTDRKRTVTVPYIADYIPTESIAYPYAYILTINDPAVNRVLKAHGVKFEFLKDSITLDVEQFNIDSLKPITRLNQGHYTNNIYGKFIKNKVKFDKNSLIVKTSQPLGRLAAYLLEPQSDDGLLYWNYFDRYLVPQWGWYYYPVPVYRVINSDDRL
ncbi:MAG: M14 family metallopeptidase [Bacteroidales bacterium]